MVLHGPHHGAQKSTSTGMSLRSICLRKRAADNSSGSPVNSAFWHLPHTGCCASLAAGTRFTASQWGQTICSDSGCTAAVFVIFISRLLQASHDKARTKKLPRCAMPDRGRGQDWKLSAQSSVSGFLAGAGLFAGLSSLSGSLGLGGLPALQIAFAAFDAVLARALHGRAAAHFISARLTRAVAMADERIGEAFHRILVAAQRFFRFFRRDASHFVGQGLGGAAGFLHVLFRHFGQIDLGVGGDARQMLLVGAQLLGGGLGMGGGGGNRLRRTVGGDDVLASRCAFFQQGLSQLDVQVAVLLNGTEQGLRHVVKERQLGFHMGFGCWGDNLRKWVHRCLEKKVKDGLGIVKPVSTPHRSANAKATLDSPATSDLDQTCVAAIAGTLQTGLILGQPFFSSAPPAISRATGRWRTALFPSIT